ncbi:Uncharacterised protein [Vibrio cholerae]|nr:Uncharacterised protein [Vibrio cholerae]CSI53576.1 Uncharacterised protein [Vibrio cholerae]
MNRLERSECSLEEQTAIDLSGADVAQNRDCLCQRQCPLRKRVSDLGRMRSVDQ